MCPDDNNSWLLSCTLSAQLLLQWCHPVCSAQSTLCTRLLGCWPPYHWLWFHFANDGCWGNRLHASLALQQFVSAFLHGWHCLELFRNETGNSRQQYRQQACTFAPHPVHFEECRLDTIQVTIYQLCDCFLWYLSHVHTVLNLLASPLWPGVNQWNLLIGTIHSKPAGSTPSFHLYHQVS